MPEQGFDPGLLNLRSLYFCIGDSKFSFILVTVLGQEEVSLG